MSSLKWLLLLLLLAIPTFSLMVRPGIYTMQDFPHFRLYEFDLCIRNNTFPCRWAPDAEMGYGEPLFNFYNQGSFWLAELFHLGGLSILDSTKAMFASTLILSGISMFLLARQYWGEKGAFISALLYMYAPYRSTDVWVRAALPEATAFIFYPLILLGLDQYLLTKKTNYLILFTLSLAGLITTHNLSVVMYMPFLAIFWLARRQFWSFPKLAMSSGLSLLLSSYYILPVIFESHLVDLTNTIKGYFDFHIHFATLRELFISRYWGYGASLWAQKFLSISVGQIQWVCALIAVAFARKTNTFLFAILGSLALFMSHGKSSIIWNTLPFMKYVQFPWRFVGVGIFFLALSSGSLVSTFKKKIIVVILIGLIVLTNYSFFRPDIWLNLTDAQFFSGKYWDESRTAHKDYWPKTAGLPPVAFSPSPHSIVYFPGWTGSVNNQAVHVYPDPITGLVSVDKQYDLDSVQLKFVDTLPRSLGNLLSVLGLVIIILWLALPPFLRSR